MMATSFHNVIYLTLISLWLPELFSAETVNRLLLQSQKVGR